MYGLLFVTTIVSAILVGPQDRLEAACGYPDWCTEPCEVNCYCDVAWNGYTDPCPSGCGYPYGWAYFQQVVTWGKNEPGEWCPPDHPCGFETIANCVIEP
jgi:hypothetical protein